MQPLDLLAASPQEDGRDLWVLESEFEVVVPGEVGWNYDTFQDDSEDVGAVESVSLEPHSGFDPCQDLLGDWGRFRMETQLFKRLPAGENLLLFKEELVGVQVASDTGGYLVFGGAALEHKCGDALRGGETDLVGFPSHQFPVAVCFAVDRLYVEASSSHLGVRGVVRQVRRIVAITLPPEVVVRVLL